MLTLNISVLYNNNKYISHARYFCQNIKKYFYNFEQNSETISQIMPQKHYYILILTKCLLSEISIRNFN